MLLATCKCHLVSTEMIPSAECQCLVFYSTCFLMWWISVHSSFPRSLFILVQFSFPISCPSRPRPRSYPVPAPVPTPILIPVLLSLAGLHLRSSSRPVPVLIIVSVPVPLPVPVPVPVLVPTPAPDPVRSFPSLGLGYPLRTMRVYRHRVLRTEVSGAYKRHPLSAKMMTRAE